MDMDVEMKIIHCNNPEENPIPKWLRKKDAPEKGKEQGEKAAPCVNFPSFCRPVHADDWQLK